MDSREKAVKGLEQFITDFKPFCGNKADWQRVDDALALLKAQEPRVMTIDELLKLQRQDVVWLEDADKEAVIPGIVITALEKEWQFMTFTGYSGLFCVSCVDYGKRWRCWTECPTDAQREAEPWN